jgi:hypothetical protein
MSQVKSALIYTALAITLAFANAVVFPLWTGYTGGFKAMLPGLENLLPYLLILVVNVGVLWVLKARTTNYSIPVRYIFLLAAFTRIAYLVTRYDQGATIADQDTALFFGYGRELALGNYTWMEYPQGSLLLFTAGYLLSGGELEIFRVILPLICLAFEFIMLGCLIWLGKRYATERVANDLCLFYAVSPFTLILWYGKFDAVPAALLTLGLVLFVAGRRFLSAFVLGIGFLVKWFPGIPLAFLFLYLIRKKEYQSAAQFTLVATLTVLIPLAIFWQISPQNFIYTYTFQGTRPAMGESLPYLILYIVEPGARLAVGYPPWDGIKSTLLTSGVSSIIMITSIGLLWIISAWMPLRKETTTVFGGLGVASFILTNRIFSPQFILVLFVIYAIGLTIFSAKSRITPIADIIILVLTFLNYLVWPLWYEHWLAASALFFALNLILVGWLIYAITRPDIEQKISIYSA